MAIKTSSRIAAKKLATENGFDTIRYKKSCFGYVVFWASNKSDNYECVGYPTFILVDKENKATIASPDETRAIMDFDYKKLKGWDLYNYFINDHPNRDYASVVALLPCACLHDIDKAAAILERTIKDRRRLVAIYPGEGEVATPDMEYVGGIMDGGLYIK